MKKYDPKQIEPKWQQVWADTKLYAAVTGDKTREKYYMLTEFPYPSGAGLHAGHTREYTLGDVMARHKRMQGYNVLYPMGYDAFGLPTENYAIKHKIAPQVATAQNIATFRQQFDAMGFSFDWDRQVNTTDPCFYKWTQWLFLKFFEAGLAYQHEMPINWCPKEKTGLANEEVVNGVHERCGTPVEKKLIKQWMLKITAYADRLIEGLKTVDYPSRIADQQVNWIGRSEGAEISFTSTGVAGNYVLLHGYSGKPDEVFLPWLNETLGRAAKVDVPALPSTEDPDVYEQATYVLEHCDLNNETVLLGHSLGAPVALKIVEQLKTPIHKLVLAAGFAQPGFKDNKPRPFENKFDWKFDWETIKRNVKEIVILRADQDYAVPAERADYLAEKLGVEVTDAIAQESHFCGDQEPAVLAAVSDKLTVYTTRPDTLAGATFLVLAPEHPLVERLTTAENRPDVNQYIQAAQAESEIDRQNTDRKKTGVFTGAYTENPLTGEKMPIWIADYVLAGYSTGAIMAVPAHDERDFAFAKAFDLPIIKVVDLEPLPTAAAGPLVNSGDFNGLKGAEAKKAILKFLENKGLARPTVNYKLRDWIFSRQHYWGEPIPIVHCPKCGAVPVPENQLPVTLPDVENYEPTDTGESPLATIESWVHTACPKCAGPAKRETDTMPNWAGSSWYYLRYMDAKNDQAFASPEAMEYWGMADLYLGGMEHTTLHLLYSRFWHQFLYDQGLVPTPEPYAARRGQGIVLAADGRKMSKSIGNVVNPTDIIATHGADTLRLYILFMAPYDETTPWSEERLNGASRFVYKVWSWHELMLDPAAVTSAGDSYEHNLGTFETEVDRVTHKTIKKIHDDFTEMRFNTVISALMEYLNFLSEAKNRSRLLQENATALRTRTVRTFVLLLAPVVPHLAEELWHELGEEGSVHVAGWPEYDSQLIKDEFITVIVQINGKVRANLTVEPSATEAELTAAAQADPKVAKLLASQTIVKTIVIPRKVVNFVVK